MSLKIQLIILGALVAVLGVVAYLELRHPNSPLSNQNAAPAAHSAAAATNAPADANVGAAPAGTTQNPGPSAADLGALADWFDLRHPGARPVNPNGGGPILGLAPETRPLAPRTPGAPDTAPAAPMMVEPGRLGGIIRVANGPAKALFEGEIYQVGERIRGTNFTLVSVDEDSVTLKDSDGRVIHRFWHD